MIDVQSVSLRFRRFSGGHGSFKQTILNSLLRRRYSKKLEFWIFRDLKLKVDHGQRLGIVGPNGAGKTTLVKLISGIYRPNSGQVRVVGRIAPLTDLGVGFNPELSGVENIFLYGAVCGQSRKSVARRVDSIIEFAGIPEFAQTPVKYYSAGMFLRLAFSAATSVEPEILLVDEVFAGGDAAFVQKATLRMNELLAASKIVVMVSHDLGMIKGFCNRVIWMDHGRIMADGDPTSVCDAYLASAQGMTPVSVGA